MARRYPVPAPGEDSRFTFGLLVDVARVLAEHGYPDMTKPYDGVGLDLVDLQAALYRLIYTNRPGPAVSPVPVARTEGELTR